MENKLFDFFNNNGPFNIDILCIPRKYPNLIYFKNKNNDFSSFYNDMIDLEDWFEVGIIKFEFDRTYNNKNYEPTIFTNLITLNIKKLPKLTKISGLFITEQGREIRSGLSLNFEDKIIQFIPSESPYGIYIEGLDGFVNLHDPEYPLERYTMKALD